MAIAQSAVDQAVDLYNSLIALPGEEQTKIAQIEWRLQLLDRKAAGRVEVRTALLTALVMQGKAAEAAAVAHELKPFIAQMSQLVLLSYLGMCRVLLLQELLEAGIEHANKIGLENDEEVRRSIRFASLLSGDRDTWTSGNAADARAIEAVKSSGVLTVMPDVMRAIVEECRGKVSIAYLDVDHSEEGSSFVFGAFSADSFSTRRDIENRIADRLGAIFEAHDLDVGAAHDAFSVIVLPITGSWPSIK